jgi:predicted methyltransferase
MSAIPTGRGRPVPANAPVYLSHFQAAPLLRAQKEGQRQVRTSVDLNLTMVIGELSDDGLVLPDGRTAGWDAIQEAASSDSACFALKDGQLQKVQEYSATTDRVYTLYPTPGAPTMLVSGIPMHRIKGTNPYHDTLTKIRALSPVHGRVLDTASGLGYTACQAARNAEWVITVELDEAAIAVARQNPWSAELFDSPRISQVIGDSFDLVPAFAGETFDFVIHDPPQFSLAGDLYSGEFYRALYRVLRPRGKLFHYIGDPESKSGASVTRGARKRLAEAGFSRVIAHPGAFGLVAIK